jgi:hypothetical protein
MRQIGLKTAELLGNPSKLKYMRQEAARYGHPSAAIDLARLIYDTRSSL